MLSKYLLTPLLLCGVMTQTTVFADQSIHHESASKPAPQRLVSASNPLTQIVSALGQDQRFVGLDKTSHTKPEYDKIPDVGYRIQLSTEGILSLKPDLILLADDSGPEATIEQLTNSNVEIIQFEELKDVASISKAVSIIAEKLHLTKEGEKLNTQISEEATALKELSYSRPALKGFFVLQGGNGHGSPQISGSDTTATKVLELLNIENLFEKDYANYRAVTIENQMQKRPEIVFLGNTGKFNLKDGSLKEEALPPFALRPEGLEGWPVALQPKCVFDVNMSNYLVFGIHIYADNLKLQEAINQCLAEQ